MTQPQTHDHIPHVPFWFQFIVVAKIIIAVVVLGLAAYGASFNDFFAGNGYAIFCSIAIFLTEGYYLATTNFITSLFNAWAYLVFSLFQAVWWLACWADLASWAGAYKVFYAGINFQDIDECSTDAAKHHDSTTFDGYDAWNDEYLDCLKGRRKKHRDAIAAAAGIGALEWILVIVTLVLFALALRRHRKSGAPFSAGSAWRTTPGNPQGVAGGDPGGHVENHQMHTKSEGTV